MCNRDLASLYFLEVSLLHSRVDTNKSHVYEYNESLKQLLQSQRLIPPHDPNEICVEIADMKLHMDTEIPFIPKE